MGKRIGQGLLILFGLLLLVGIFGSSNEAPAGSTNEAAAVDAGTGDSAPSPTVLLPSPSIEPEAAETEAPSPSPTKAEPEITVAQENAIESAQDYLDYTAFSRSGLIDQLEYEGYTTKDATFAVDYLDVNWNQQAATSAQDYLDYSSFSRTGLIDQLIYEGFTREQAIFGVNAVGL